MTEETPESPKCPSGLPPWMATFADMMTLLMCFFVLLTSTSVQDAKKYKAMVDSMKNAFGGYSVVAVDQIPINGSVIPHALLSIQTEPKSLSQIRQLPEDIEHLKERAMKATLAEINDEAEKIKRELKDEIKNGLVNVEANGLQIIMRIEEKGSFTSGSAILKPGFETVMDKIADSIKQAKGNIRVAGHTDDIPITTSSYRSNWELSSSRAVSVAHYLLMDKGISSERIAIEGYADTKPLIPNISKENRAKNRRVEVILIQEDPTIRLVQKKIPHKQLID
jgi:chemotaxis protein MotB